MNAAAALAQLLPDIRQAWSQLAHHRLRTALTLLGMVFGVGAVIAMLAVSEGGRRQALEMIEGMGVRNLIVEAAEPDGEALKDIRRHSAGLTTADARAITDTLPFIEAWSGVRAFEVWDLFSREGTSDAEVWAVSPGYFALSRLGAEQGALFTDAQDARFEQVAVLGSAAARDLFPNGGAVGGLIKVNHLWLQVIAVLVDRQLPDARFQGRAVGGDSERIYLPLQTGLKRLKLEPLKAELTQLKLKVSKAVTPTAAAAAVEHLLARRHGGQNDYRLTVPARLLAQRQQTQRISTIVMSAVA